MNGICIYRTVVGIGQSVRQSPTAGAAPVEGQVHETPMQRVGRVLAQGRVLP